MRYFCCGVVFVLAYLGSPTAWAQECPEGYTCLSEEPTHCLSADQLQAHEARLRECDSARSEMRGRLEECRDQVEPLQLRVEELAAGRRQAQRSEKLWRGVAGGAVGLAVFSTVTLVGEMSGWWDL